MGCKSFSRVAHTPWCILHSANHFILLRLQRVVCRVDLSKQKMHLSYRLYLFWKKPQQQCLYLSCGVLLLSWCHSWWKKEVRNNFFLWQKAFNIGNHKMLLSKIVTTWLCWHWLILALKTCICLARGWGIGSKQWKMMEILIFVSSLPPNCCHSAWLHQCDETAVSWWFLDTGWRGCGRDGSSINSELWIPLDTIQHLTDLALSHRWRCCHSNPPRQSTLWFILQRFLSCLLYRAPAPRLL